MHRLTSLRYSSGFHTQENRLLSTSNARCFWDNYPNYTFNIHWSIYLLSDKYTRNKHKHFPSIDEYYYKFMKTSVHNFVALSYEVLVPIKIKGIK